MGSAGISFQEKKEEIKNNKRLLAQVANLKRSLREDYESTPREDLRRNIILKNAYENVKEIESTSKQAYDKCLRELNELFNLVPSPTKYVRLKTSAQLPPKWASTYLPRFKSYPRDSLSPGNFLETNMESRLQFKSPMNSNPFSKPRSKWNFTSPLAFKPIVRDQLSPVKSKIIENTFESKEIYDLPPEMEGKKSNFHYKSQLRPKARIKRPPNWVLKSLPTFEHALRDPLSPIKSNLPESEEDLSYQIHNLQSKIDKVVSPKASTRSRWVLISPSNFETIVRDPPTPAKSSIEMNSSEAETEDYQDHSFERDQYSSPIKHKAPIKRLPEWVLKNLPNFELTERDPLSPLKIPEGEHLSEPERDLDEQVDIGKAKPNPVSPKNFNKTRSRWVMRSPSNFEPITRDRPSPIKFFIDLSEPQDNLSEKVQNLSLEVEKTKLKIRNALNRDQSQFNNSKIPRTSYRKNLYTSVVNRDRIIEESSKKSVREFLMFREKIMEGVKISRDKIKNCMKQIEVANEGEIPYIEEEVRVERAILDQRLEKLKRVTENIMNICQTILFRNPNIKYSQQFKNELRSIIVKLIQSGYKPSKIALSVRRPLISPRVENSKLYIII